MPWLLKGWKSLLLHAPVPVTSVNFFLLTIPSLGLGLPPLSIVPCTLFPRFVIYDPTNSLSQFSALQFLHVSITSTSSQKWDSSSPTISCHYASELNSFLLHRSMASPDTLYHWRQLRKSSILLPVLTVEAIPWKTKWGKVHSAHHPPTGVPSSSPGSGAVAQLLTGLGCSACLQHPEWVQWSSPQQFLSHEHIPWALW